MRIQKDRITDEIWIKPISAVLTELGTTSIGLAQTEVDRRRGRYGYNRPPTRPLFGAAEARRRAHSPTKQRPALIQIKSAGPTGC
ncbi:hypothetical protein FZ029_32040 [Azospirillum sp. Sh1]|nr:hypothetical protein FZ029_32040 [Azospirillum sp. Sh1]